LGQKRASASAGLSEASIGAILERPAASSGKPRFAVAMRSVGARVDAGLYRWSRGHLSIAGPNLAADPYAFVQLGRHRGAYLAYLAEPAEVDRYWAELLEAWPAHATYHQRSGVRMVYVLDPVPAP
jgi:hypothetical protein